MDLITIITSLATLALEILKNTNVLKEKDADRYRDVILSLESAAKEILERADALRKIAQQNAELTPEQEAELDAKINDAFRQTRWKLTDE